MDHEFSEVQELLGQTAREFFSRDYPLDRMRDIFRTPAGYDADIWRNMVELGWTAAPFPESMGGTGGGFLDSVLLLEEIGKGCATSPYGAVRSAFEAWIELTAVDTASIAIERRLAEEGLGEEPREE